MIFYLTSSYVGQHPTAFPFVKDFIAWETSSMEISSFKEKIVNIMFPFLSFTTLSHLFLRRENYYLKMVGYYCKIFQATENRLKLRFNVKYVHLGQKLMISEKKFG